MTTTNLSPEFIKAREDFATWYDSKSEDEQELIDEISDRTSFIIDEDEYDEFLKELDDCYSITTASDFEDAFEGEFEGTGERVTTEFAENFVDSCGYSLEPEWLSYCIDYSMVWSTTLQYDFSEIEYKGNTYFFRNI